ncbi:TetR/AcrR family transcriptional regulator [Hyphomonas sp.]|uniref:TetR/AcrR family transcriptional regulator n=1 Tax=Hyphomonas sp. TaxID=87 RepID=UPI003919CD24
MSTDAPLTETAPATGRREEAKAERRARIRRAARDLIRETGDTNVPMRELARRAEVSVATAYNLFGSKRAVMLAVLEDERDFVQRFQRLKVRSAIDRIFEAHAIAYGYFVQDPDFYRPLWRALLGAGLGSGTGDETGLASPERRAQTQAAWWALLETAQSEGLLKPEVNIPLLERSLSNLAAGTLLSWAAGVLDTEDLMASVGLGYALLLTAAATPSGQQALAARTASYQKMLISR